MIHHNNKQHYNDMSKKCKQIGYQYSDWVKACLPNYYFEQNDDPGQLTHSPCHAGNTEALSVKDLSGVNLNDFVCVPNGYTAGFGDPKDTCIKQPLASLTPIFSSAEDCGTQGRKKCPADGNCYAYPDEFYSRCDSSQITCLLPASSTYSNSGTKCYTTDGSNKHVFCTPQSSSTAQCESGTDCPGGYACFDGVCTNSSGTNFDHNGDVPPENDRFWPTNNSQPESNSYW